jgi:hypothetical protein
MIEAAARNLRTAERFLLAPPLTAHFGAAVVSVCDISAKGARFRHDRPLETGQKSLLRVAVEPAQKPVDLEAVVVWTQSDSSSPGKFVSGVRTYADVPVVDRLIAHLQLSKRTSRIEELRSADRFLLGPMLDAWYAGEPSRIEDLSTRGARVELGAAPPIGSEAPLRFDVPQTQVSIEVPARVVWSGVKSIGGDGAKRYRCGLEIREQAERIRLAIGKLCELGHAALDAHSLRLKVKILRARARQLAPSLPDLQISGVPAEQYLLIQGVREELRLNPEEAMHWYRRARISINDPVTRTLAPPIADHPDALAVWEYLDRSVDPSLIGRTFAVVK